MEINNKLNLQSCVCLPNYYYCVFAAEEKKPAIGLLNQFHMQQHNEEPAIFHCFLKQKINSFSKY